MPKRSLSSAIIVIDYSFYSIVFFLWCFNLVASNFDFSEGSCDGRMTNYVG